MGYYDEEGENWREWIFDGRYDNRYKGVKRHGQGSDPEPIEHDEFPATEHDVYDENTQYHKSRKSRRRAGVILFMVFCIGAVLIGGSMLSGSGYFDFGSSIVFYHDIVIDIIDPCTVEQGANNECVTYDVRNTPEPTQTTPEVGSVPEDEPVILEPTDDAADAIKADTGRTRIGESPRLTLTFNLEDMPPNIPDRNLVETGIMRAFDIWESHNKGLEFIKTKERDADITVSWYEITPESHLGMATTIEGQYGGHIDIGLGKHDCNGMYVQHDQNSITNTMMHEIGHTLGIGHTYDKTHLMYGDDLIEAFDSIPYEIPIQIDGFYVGYNDLKKQYDELDIMITNFKERRDEIKSEYDKANAVYDRIKHAYEEIDMRRISLLEDIERSEGHVAQYHELVVELNRLKTEVNEAADIANNLASTWNRSGEGENKLIIRQNAIVNKMNCYPDIINE